MATTDNRQLISKLTFFPSYPLFAYANGYLYSYDGYETFDPFISIETMNSLITLNPSKRHLIIPDTTHASSFLKWWTRPAGGTMNYQGSGALDTTVDIEEDFFMVLGHNFNETQQSIGYTGNNPIEIVNGCLNNPPDYDGWSYMENTGSTLASQMVTFNTGDACEVGSFLWGKKWEAPQNVDIGQSLQVSYGNKIQTTVGGKKISTMNYSGPNMWGDVHAWELLPHLNKELTNVHDAAPYWLGKQFDPPRTGLRTWKVKFSLMQSSQMMPQNSMINNLQWDQDSTGNYDIDANGDSLTNITASNDFFSNVYRITQGNHLPCVIRISDSNNNDQFAIVRISQYKITETNPKFVSISLTLEEQV